MSRKIIGVTVGTTINPESVVKKYFEKNPNGTDFIINLNHGASSSELIADKSFLEIKNAVASGKNCVVVYYDDRYNFSTQYNSNQYDFEKNVIREEVIINNRMTIKSDGTVTFTQSTLDFGKLQDTINNMNNTSTTGGKGWTTEQIDLLDSLLSLIPFTSFEGGTIADRLITSLRSQAVEPDNPSDNPDVESGVVQNGRVLTIIRGVASSQNGTTLLIA